jgi:hypothetical protein
LLEPVADSLLAEGIRGSRLNLAFAVSDHVLAGADVVASAVALAEAALESRTVAEPGNVIRGLVRLACAEVDRTLFFTPTSLPMWLARRAILADRRGPDGRAVIDAALACRAEPS